MAVWIFGVAGMAALRDLGGEISDTQGCRLLFSK